MRKLKALYSGTIFTELYTDGTGSLLEVNGSKAWWSNNDLKGRLVEYKEPVKLTVWKNVWQRKDGSYFFGCDWPDEQSAKRDAYDIRETIKYIKTVKFETEIEQ